MMARVAGSCLCGSIRFEFESDGSNSMEHCHCSMCRKAHGASFVTWIDLPASRLHWLAGREHIRWYRSSAKAQRGFCDSCGSHLIWQADAHPEVLSVAAGVLDGDPGCRPSRQIYVASRAPWVEPDAALPQFAQDRANREP